MSSRIINFIRAWGLNHEHFAFSPRYGQYMWRFVTLQWKSAGWPVTRYWKYFVLFVKLFCFRNKGKSWRHKNIKWQRATVRCHFIFYPLSLGRFGNVCYWTITCPKIICYVVYNFGNFFFFFEFLYYSRDRRLCSFNKTIWNKFSMCKKTIIWLQLNWLA